MTYSEKLKDPRWQRKRLDILSRDDFTCKACFDNKSELHVHHIVYDKNSFPWECNNDELITLCKHCHDELHENLRYQKSIDNDNYIECSIIFINYKIYRSIYLHDINFSDFMRINTFRSSNVKLIGNGQT